MLLSLAWAASLLAPLAASAAPDAAQLRTRQATAVPVIRGVNLGGWLIAESWITPSLFSSGGESAIDEWTLGVALGKDRTLALLSDHWSSFFTRDDLVDIKAAGLTHVRIPVGYWAVDVLESEPFVTGQFPYLLRAVQWARELSLGVMVDLHGLPGSQNGDDHSGRVGTPLYATNGTNLDRALGVLRNLTEEFTRAEYGGAVQAIEVMNEPRLFSNGDASFTMPYLKDTYAQASVVIRSVAAAVGMTVTIHDAFWGSNYWRGYDPSGDDNNGSGRGQSPDWLQLDVHEYYAFAPRQNLPRDQIIDSICNTSRLLKSTSSGRPGTVVGEWSLETGTPPNTTRPAQDWRLTREKRTWLRLLFEAQLAAYSPTAADQASQGWYFWTWKTEYGIDTWDLRNGIRNGYVPSDLSNASLLVFPIFTEGENAGCVDAGYNYTAPARPRPDGESGASLAINPARMTAALVGWATLAALLALS